MENDFILFAVPVFLVLIVVELVYGILTKRNTYRLNDTISSLSQGLLSQVVAICTPFFQIGAYQMIYSSLGRYTGVTLWGHWEGWLLALLIYDFSDYWLHRVSHQSALFWGAHVIHHQSQFFNLSTALRQESLYPIVGCFFFFPMALLGIPPAVFAGVSLFVLFYQFWIHTEHIGRLGWFDRVFSSPSNHRVHHAVNPEYLDKNFGAVLIVWDRMFGTYRVEDVACRYGTTTPLNSWNPFHALTTVYADLFAKSRATPGWLDRCRIWFKAPGWSPAALVKTAPKSAPKPWAIYNPSFRASGKLLAVILFIAAGVVTAWFLFQDDQLSAMQKLVGLGSISLVLSLTGFYMAAPKRQQQVPDCADLAG